ncbi:hypothetical protein ALC53_03206 [Atta colombica]|uniref:Uncharacterized protein n=1 Tax=Atta colombica TaxID=520822 RepID=A0A151I5S2_9HYME|nr:hypothetical protein ALC53_03206 [Atta colombica]
MSRFENRWTVFETPGRGKSPLAEELQRRRYRVVVIAFVIGSWDPRNEAVLRLLRVGNQYAVIMMRHLIVSCAMWRWISAHCPGELIEMSLHINAFECKYSIACSIEEKLKCLLASCSYFSLCLDESNNSRTFVNKRCERGSKTGFYGQIRINFKFSVIHYIIHQEALCRKAIKLCSTMKIVTKIVNSIKGGHKFLSHQWLSAAKYLEKFFAIRKEIFLFLQETSVEKDDDFKSLFEDVLCELAFITDLNQLISHIDSFRKLLLFKNHLEENFSFLSFIFIFLVKYFSKNTTQILFKNLVTMKVEEHNFKNTYNFKKNFEICKENKGKYTQRINKITILVQSHDLHLKNVELARKALQEDKILASKNLDKYFAFSFDLQKALPYSKLSVSIAYYKRNMYVLKGFHNFHNNKINMGSQEIASCCLRHLQNVTT